MAKILIIDDDIIFCDLLSYFVEQSGHLPETAMTFSDGLRKAQNGYYPVIFLDLVLPNFNGIRGICKLKDIHYSPEIIVITGHGDEESAETAITEGALYYIHKPVSQKNIDILIKRTLEYREKKACFETRYKLDRISLIGNSVKLNQCLNTVSKTAFSDKPVLITGETGTGKEVIARVIHCNSPKKKHIFFPVDCTNIPDNLAASLLFGYEKGAFTGADRHKEGLITQAGDGTLFLDEVCDLPLNVQGCFLRVLENKKILPLGAKKEISCNFRVISATNKNPEELISKGLFRRDLYFRLSAFHIHVPPLREHKEDIAPLMNHYIVMICNELEIPVKCVSEDFTEYLIAYSWLGNVRELINTLHAAISSAKDEPVLYPHHLPADIRAYSFKTQIKQGTSWESKISLPISKSEDIWKPACFPKFKEFHRLCDNIAEAEYIEHLIEISDGDINKACTLSDISRSRLYQLLKKYGKHLK